MPAIFQHLRCNKQLLTHIAVGMGAASFWRGAWYILDDHLFPNNAEHSAAASWVLGVAGMRLSQGLVAQSEQLAKRVEKHAPSKLVLKTTQTAALYTIAMSCVLVWRGTWLGWDCLYERWHSEEATAPGHATRSGLVSHIVALTLLLGSGLFASVLAPPAAVSVIRDFAIKTSSSIYVPPAQVITNRLFGSRGIGTTTPTIKTTTSIGGSITERTTKATCTPSIRLTHKK
jgi:hypothetical protein